MALQLRSVKEIRLLHNHGANNQSFAQLRNGFVSRGNSLLIAKSLRFVRKASSRACVRATLETPAVARAKGRPGEHKGFIEEMRITAMRLHTKYVDRNGISRLSYCK